MASPQVDSKVTTTPRLRALSPASLLSLLPLFEAFDSIISRGIEPNDVVSSNDLVIVDAMRQLAMKRFETQLLKQQAGLES